MDGSDVGCHRRCERDVFPCCEEVASNDRNVQVRVFSFQRQERKKIEMKTDPFHRSTRLEGAKLSQRDVQLANAFHRRVATSEGGERWVRARSELRGWIVGHRSWKSSIFFSCETSKRRRSIGSARASSGSKAILHRPTSSHPPPSFLPRKVSFSVTSKDPSHVDGTIEKGSPTRSEGRKNPF